MERATQGLGVVPELFRCLPVVPPDAGILDGDPRAKLQRFDDGLAREARRMAFRRQHDSKDDEREYDEGKYEQLNCDKLRLLI